MGGATTYDALVGLGFLFFCWICAWATEAVVSLAARARRDAREAAARDRLLEALTKLGETYSRDVDLRAKLEASRLGTVVFPRAMS